MKELRRTTRSYIFHGLFIILATYFAYSNGTSMGRYSWVAIGLVASISFVSVLIKRNYFESGDGKLFINKEFFRTQSIEISKIVKVIIEPGPFKSSSILLKDNSRIKFNDSNLEFNELKRFMSSLNIMVE
jgi:uncharacterized membrane protein